jgi:dTDP-4-amino-4,6-dideoxygalactose transaminase
MRKLLLKKGIETGIYYPQPLHLQQSFKYLGYQKGDLPVSERVAKEIFSIPVYPELSAQQVQTIISSVIESYDEISQK